jgi:hypothetical protein
MKQEVQSLQEKNTYLESVLQQAGVKQRVHRNLQVSTCISADVQRPGLHNGPIHIDVVPNTVSHFH